MQTQQPVEMMQTQQPFHESGLTLDYEPERFLLDDDLIDPFHDDRMQQSQDELNLAVNNFMDPFHDDWPYW